MAMLRGCELPEDYFYNIENNVWAQKNGSLVTIGMTTYACALSGEIVSISCNQVGKTIKKNKSCVTVQSNDWVGVVKSPLTGKVIEFNESLLENPSLINQDPYGRGWLVKIKVNNWDGETEDLHTGELAMDSFEDKMDAEGFAGC